MKPKSWSRPIPSPAAPRRMWCRAVLVLLAALLWATAGAEAQTPDASVPAAAVTITDDLGRTVRLERPAGRVVALYGAFNELLAALGREDVIAARTKADTLPPSILDKPLVGTHMRPNLEIITALKPDLVLQMGGRAEAAQSVADLERLGIPAALFAPDDFESLFTVFERVGVLVGAEAAARELVAAQRARLDAVAQAVAGAPRPGVAFETRYPNLLCAGQGSMTSGIIARAGGENVVTAPDKLVRLGEEELLRLDPDVYLVQRGPMNPAPSAPADRPHFAGLRAVRDGRVLLVDEAL
ncbi:MAG: ABC transporter substrate-binding protein, partial [Desulfovibrionaceae bacterium]